MVTNFGRLEELALANELGVLHKYRESIKLDNIFTKVGERLEKMSSDSVLFNRRFDKKRLLGRAGTRLKNFGATKTGKALGRIPYANLVWGLVNGFSMMDQYENATKGFIVETAAGAAEAATWALFRPGLWLAAGFKLAGVGTGILPGIGTAIGFAIGFVGAAVANIAIMMGASWLAGNAVRYPTAAILGARKRRMPDPAAYTAPEQLYDPEGIQGMRGPVNQWNMFHGLDPARPDMTPFGGAYNPIQGQDIDTKTLQITESKRKVTSSPKGGRPISMFTPTFGLVNNVLWNGRRNSRVRSVVERYSGQTSVPKLDRNRSRMQARAA
jgi:hypothetical protein